MQTARRIPQPHISWNIQTFLRVAAVLLPLVLLVVVEVTSLEHPLLAGGISARVAEAEAIRIVLELTSPHKCMS